MNPIIIQRMRALLILRYYIEIYKLLLLVYQTAEKCIRPVSDIVKYSPFGQRISKIVNGDGEYYVYEHNKLKADIITDYDNSLNVKVKYIMHPKKIDDPIIQKINTIKYYYQLDANDSITSIINENATTKNRYVYYAFGESKSKTETIENRYQYTSREKEENDFYYYRSRIYNPIISRFLNKDKASCGLTLYTYVKNNPMRYFDPLGFCHCEKFSAPGDASETWKCHSDDLECPDNTIEECSGEAGNFFSSEENCVSACKTSCTGDDDDNGNGSTRERGCFNINKIVEDECGNCLYEVVEEIYAYSCRENGKEVPCTEEDHEACEDEFGKVGDHVKCYE